VAHVGVKWKDYIFVLRFPTPSPIVQEVPEVIYTGGGGVYGTADLALNLDVSLYMYYCTAKEY
jgi:hypothetical protein